MLEFAAAHVSLYGWRMSNLNAVAMRAAILVPNCSTGFEVNYDYGGGDLETRYAPPISGPGDFYSSTGLRNRQGIASADDCALLCGTVGGCQSWTYNKDPGSERYKRYVHTASKRVPISVNFAS